MRGWSVVLIFAGANILIGCGPTKRDEEVLKQDLFALRRSIDSYTMDRGKAPQSLDDLVHAGYLRAIPLDPITHKSDWVPVEDDSLQSVDQIAPGIADVHSASRVTARDGTAYSSW
jgi:general secretion pathway protein G